MPDKFDPYREALVLETATVWPDDCTVPPGERASLERALHAAPQQAAHLEYVRLHTGFQRSIVVTPADLTRLGR